MLKQNLQDSETGQVKFLLTSRPYHNITSRFQGLIEDSLLVHVSAEQEVETISEDINLVIEYRVRQLVKAKILNNHLSECLKQQLLQIEHRTYLWVYLVFGIRRFQKDRKGYHVVAPKSTQRHKPGLREDSKQIEK